MKARMLPSFPLSAVLLCCVALAAASDLAWRRIPNRLVLAGLALALPLQLLAHPDQPWWGAALWLGGAATGLALFLPLYLMRGMAAGDVKLLAMVGGFAGPALTWRISLATCLAGGVMALLILLYRGRCRSAVANLRTLLSGVAFWLAGAALTPAPLPPGASVGGMPYGVAIAAATLAVLLLADH